MSNVDEFVLQVASENECQMCEFLFSKIMTDQDECKLNLCKPPYGHRLYRLCEAYGAGAAYYEHLRAYHEVTA